ncbi:MAG: polyprenyl diphosphate synthase [Rikenellaceae bacterium]
MSSTKKIPNSIAIIMDGNGRWAEAQGLDRVEGHVRGVESVRRSVEAAIDYGVGYLTLYAFSTENWGRPEAEVIALMELLGRCIVNEVPDLIAKGVRITFIGDISRFSEKMQHMLMEAAHQTAGCSKLVLQVALNYSSRDELRRTMYKIATEIKSGAIDINDISEELISNKLDTAGVPDPDLIIRTSGEMRLSNFLMWQASYAELYFPDVLWPDFDGAEFAKALEVYANRDRRFGLVKEREE